MIRTVGRSLMCGVLGVAATLPTRAVAADLGAVSPGVVTPVAFPVPPFAIPGSAVPPRPVTPKPPDKEPDALDGVPRLPPPKPAPELMGPVRSTGGPPVSLDEVLESVERAYPGLLALFLDVNGFDGNKLAGLGRFECPAPVVTACDTAAGCGPCKTSKRPACPTPAVNWEAVGPTAGERRLAFQRTAARAYWAWVAAGHNLNAARDHLAPARDRDDKLRTKAIPVPDPRPVAVENLRELAHRNLRVVDAEKLFRRAQVELSLFLRDPATGDPVLAGLDRVPAFPRLLEPDPDRFQEAVRTAIDQRPELVRLRHEAEAVEATRVVVGRHRFPWQRREAEGNVRLVDSRVSNLLLKQRFAADAVRAELQDALARLERAYEGRKEARRWGDLARKAAADERKRFDLGLSDVAKVSGREADALDADAAETAALFDYFVALADYRAALGLGADGPQPTALPADPAPPRTLPPAEKAQADKFDPPAAAKASSKVVPKEKKEVKTAFAPAPFPPLSATAEKFVPVGTVKKK